MLTASWLEQENRLFIESIAYVGTRQHAVSTAHDWNGAVPIQWLLMSDTNGALTEYMYTE